MHINLSDLEVHQMMGHDTLHGGDKVNDNFVELYTLLGTGSGLTSGMSATATVVTLTAQ